MTLGLELELEEVKPEEELEDDELVIIPQVSGEKTAVIVFDPFIVTEQVYPLVLVQFPLQPLKVEPSVSVAVNVSPVPDE